MLAMQRISCSDVNAMHSITIEKKPRSKERELVIRIPMSSEPRLSRSGRFVILASTGGFIKGDAIALPGLPLVVTVSAGVGSREWVKQGRPLPPQGQE